MICERLAGRPVVYAKKRRCDLVAVGSLLDRFKERFFHPCIHVWGTGFIEPTHRRKSRFRYDAVRGRHSARLIEGPTVEVFGDPGLLVDVLWPELKKTPRRHRVGLIPHYEDRAAPEVRALANTLGSCTIVDVFDDVTDVLRQIVSCECVLSSSLHGLIVADAFGVPNARMKLSEKIRGQDFKFRDYYSIYDLEDYAVPLQARQIDRNTTDTIMENYTRPGLETIKERLIAAFPFAR
jgi:hypothetical protein